MPPSKFQRLCVIKTLRKSEKQVNKFAPAWIIAPASLSRRNLAARSHLHYAGKVTSSAPDPCSGRNDQMWRDFVVATNVRPDQVEDFEEK